MRASLIPKIQKANPEQIAPIASASPKIARVSNGGNIQKISEKSTRQAQQNAYNAHPTAGDDENLKPAKLLKSKGLANVL